MTCCAMVLACMAACLRWHSHRAIRFWALFMAPLLPFLLGISGVLAGLYPGREKAFGTIGFGLGLAFWIVIWSTLSLQNAHLRLFA